MRLPSFAILIATIALGVLVAAQPARANITLVSLATPQYTNLPCPTTIPVTAVVIGSPGQAFTATIETNSVNGQKLIGPAPGTLPSTGPKPGVLSGTLQVPVNAESTITYTAFINGLSVSATVGSVNTNPSSIHVTCAGGTSPQNLHGADLPVANGLAVNVPNSCLYFSNSETSACQTALNDKKVVLTWGLIPGCVSYPCSTPDGWNIQRSSDRRGWVVHGRSQRDECEKSDRRRARRDRSGRPGLVLSNLPV